MNAIERLLLAAEATLLLFQQKELSYTERTSLASLREAIIKVKRESANAYQIPVHSVNELPPTDTLHIQPGNAGG